MRNPVLTVNRLPSSLGNSANWLYQSILIFFVAISSAILIPNDGKSFYSGDDDDYFAIAASIAFGEFPSYDKDFHVGDKMPFASVGPGVLAAPFVFITSLVDRYKNHSIVQERTKENRADTWSVIGFYLASQTYLLLSVLLMYRLANEWADRKSSFYATLLTVLAGGGILIYAFVRPVMSHVYELFSITLSLYALCKVSRGERSTFLWITLGASIAFVFLTRYNNAILALCMALVIVYWMFVRKVSVRFATLCLGLTTMLVLVFRVLPVFVNGFSEADQGYLDAGTRLLRLNDVDFYYQRLVQIFLGTDMGLIFTGPALFLSMITFVLTRKVFPIWYLILGSTFLINVAITAQWCSTGSFFGYRYFAFTASALLIASLAVAIQPLTNRISHLACLCLVCIISLYPVSSMLLFGKPGGFYLDAVTTICGFPAYGNSEFQINSIRRIGQDPAKVVVLAYELAIGGFIERLSLDSAGRQKAVTYLFPLVFLFGFLLLESIRASLIAKHKRTKAGN